MSTRNYSWQTRALTQWSAEPGPDFALFATMGAGKTRAALKIARAARLRRGIRQHIVVVHSRYLAEKWRLDAQKEGLEFEIRSNRLGAETPPDISGLIVTYQQVGFNPDLHRIIAGSIPTQVIFDEVHHAGDQHDWGKALRHAYEPAALRLLLSGTPLRSEGDNIVFLTKTTPHLIYSYTEAMADGLCRPPGIQTFEGDLWWLDEDQERVEASFSKPLNQRDQRRRLISAIQDTDGWLSHVLVEADLRLSACRDGEGQATDAGIVFASDTRHVLDIVELLERRCPGEVVSVTYDDEDALERIAAFDAGEGRWLVCIKMIGEGLHIDRLRVGVYASTTATELFFRQAFGRLVVRGEDDDAPAYFYIPKDPTLLVYATRLEEEGRSVFPETPEGDLPPGPGGPGGPRLWTPGGGPAYRDDFYSHQVIFGPEELTRAQELKTLTRLKVPLEDIAKLVRANASLGDRDDGLGRHAVPNDTASLRSALRRQSNYLVARLHHQTREPHEEINKKLARLTDATLNAASIEQLKARIQLLQTWLST